MLVPLYQPKYWHIPGVHYSHLECCENSSFHIGIAVLCFLFFRYEDHPSEKVAETASETDVKKEK